MVVQHNLTAINANRYFGINNTKLSKSLEKLSSGYAINRAGDNAAGLAVSEKMRAQISGINQGVKNAQDGISMVQTFEGALTETDSILQRMRTLATQSANGTYQNDVDREAIQLEYDQLNDELNQIADTDFNGVVVLNGGEMADGLKAVNGEFNYADAKRDAQQVGSAGGFVTNISKDMTAAEAKALKAETVTFTAAVGDDGKVTWTASAGNLNGNVGTEDNGGFSYANAKVHVDSSKIVAGDTIVLEIAPGADANVAEAKVVGTNTDYGTTVKTEIDAKKPTLTLEAATAATSEKVINAQNALDKLSVSITTAKTRDEAQVKLNGKALGKDATTYAEFAKTEDGGYLGVNNAGEIKYFEKGDAAGVVIGSLSNIADGKITLDAAATASGTATIDYNVTKGTYKPAEGPTINLVEPDSKVSQSNSNNASAATLTYKDNITLQVGARTKDSVNFTFAYDSNGLGDLKADMDCSARGLGTDKLSLATQESANAAIDKIDNALNKVSMVRGTFGAVQNRLEHKIDNLNTTSENLTSAESRIRDTNMAEEMMNFTKNQILSQASQSMLAQANQLPQGVLSLLQ